MSEQIEPKLTDHHYDGIMEYDNPTPGWWTWIFVGTVIFSAVYFFVAETSGGALSAIYAYESAQREELKRQYGELGDLANDDKSVLTLMKSEKWQKVGEAIYATNCVACHGRSGGGVTAPNLTDDSYIYVKKPADIVDVVLNGRKNGAMPAWKNTLRGPEALIVSSYVANLRGKNESGKGPEGNAIPAWEAK